MLPGGRFLDGCKYVLLNRDTKFYSSFRTLLLSAGVETIVAISEYTESGSKTFLFTILSSIAADFSKTLPSHFPIHMYSYKIFN